jgi:uncharacterized Zn-binding protein involved in type VI secretion
MPEQQKNETTYLFVTIGSRTERGGRVTRVSTMAEYQGMALARVGDIVTYDDGGEATIIDGAGYAAAWGDKPLALVGSRLSNGDTIMETSQDGWGITVRDGDQAPGLFDPVLQLPRLVRQAQKSGVVRHVGSGGNIWSNVHIGDVVELYRLALEKMPAGTFYFVESDEASFGDMSAAIARSMKLGPAQDWPLKDSEQEWGYEMANYGLGSNSRVRGERARKLLGWQPKRTSVIDWIEHEMMSR